MPGKQPKCRYCAAPIVFFFSPHSSALRKFDAKPVDGRNHHTGVRAYPVEGRRAWKLPELVEDLQVRRECSKDAAEAEAYDMPWYVPHDCPNSPFRVGASSETPSSVHPHEGAPR